MPRDTIVVSASEHTMLSPLVTSLSGAVLFTSLLRAHPVAAVPTASLSTRDSPIPGYSVVKPVWAVQTAPDGATVNVTGTVQDVIRYAEKVNSNFRSDFALDQGSKVSSQAVPFNKGRGVYVSL